MERKARTDPKAFARTPAEEDRADAATQCLRYIADDNSFSLLRSLVFENMLIGRRRRRRSRALRTMARDRATSPSRTFRGIASGTTRTAARCDFSDARYKGMVIWTDRDALEEMYPDADDVIESIVLSSTDFYYNDRPETAFWTDNNRTRVRLVQCDWAERGTWWRATYTKSGLLAKPQRSKFKDRKGKSCSGLLLQSSYINRENQRYGMVRGLISLQDEINKRRSKAMHLLNVHQVIAEQGAVPDVDKARREVAKPDGYVEVMPGLKFEIQQTTDLAAGQFQLLQHATAEMQLSGPNAAMSGTDPRELSGRAILASRPAVQRRTSRWPMRCGSGAGASTRAAGWQRGSIGTAGKWVRVTDDLNETRWVGINRPVRLMDKLADMPEQHRAMVMQQMQTTARRSAIAAGHRHRERHQRSRRGHHDRGGHRHPEPAGRGVPEPRAAGQRAAGADTGRCADCGVRAARQGQILERMKEHQQQQQQAQQQAGQTRSAARRRRRSRTYRPRRPPTWRWRRSAR